MTTLTIIRRLQVIDEALNLYPNMFVGARRGYKAERTRLLKKLQAGVAQ
jgi:hypothetical protein